MANYNLTQTGAQVQQLLDTVAAGYIYMGTADLTTTPDTTNPNVCYLLTAVGTYTNFGNIQHASGIGIAIWNGTAWSYQNVPSAAVVQTDTTPTKNSTTPVQSGGVWNSINPSVSEGVEYTKKSSVMFNGTKFITVSPSFYTWYYKALYPTSVSLTFTRNDSYTYDGKICIVDDEADIVKDATATQLAQVSYETTYTNTYSLNTGQCLCVAARASDVMSVTLLTKPLASSVGELNTSVNELLSDMSALKNINQTYPNIVLITGAYVGYSSGKITSQSGTNVFSNIPVIPNSSIRLTLTSVTSASGRGFAFYAKDGKYISGTAAVSGTIVYDFNVPSNAVTMAITIWATATNTFEISVLTSSTNLFDSAYKRVAPALYSTEAITDDSTLNSYVNELYVDRELYNTLTGKHLAIRFYTSKFLLYIINTSASSVVCSASATTTTAGNVLVLKVSSTDDSDNFPLGMTIGYAVLNEVVATTTRYNIVAPDYITTLKNSPQCAAFIASKNNDFSQGIRLCMPDNITAVVGDTLQLFYRGFIFSPCPEKYDILVSCAKGKQLPRYFEYTPTSGDVGTTTFTLTVRSDDKSVLATKSCTLTTVAEASSPSSSKKVLCFGASTTQNGEWPHEADRRLTGSGGTPTALGLFNIAFCGSMNANGTGYFGKGGWNWSSYTTNNRKAYRFQVSGVNTLTMGATYTNNGNTFTIVEVNVTGGTGNILCSVASLTPAPSASGTLTKASGTGDATITYSSVSEDTSNPLWDSVNKKMSFVPYATANSSNQIDYVYVWLGLNGLSAGQSDFTSVIADVTTFADTLHAEYPSAKLKILGGIVPSFRGGMGANYGATGTGFADWYGILQTSFNLWNAYQDFANQSAYSGFVEFVNVATQFDTAYNMPHTEKAVNTRNTSVTEWVDTNGVHPANVGYMQVADVVYRNICKELA